MAEARRGSAHISPDCRGTNFWRTDPGLRALLGLYLDAPTLAHLTPHYDAFGEVAGGRLDELAEAADKNPPVLRARDRFGRDEDRIEYHPAYHEMARIAFGDLGLHRVGHRPGGFGLDRPLPPLAKYAFTYLFTQAEFGLMCPVSLSDTAAYVIDRFAGRPLKDYLLPRMLHEDPAEMWTGTQFMTEKSGGSDVGVLESTAERVGVDEDGLDVWTLTGDKWFCSHTDADVALVLARPAGKGPGTRNLALFAMPRRRKDGSRNAYRIARLKDKLGTRSMASGEILLNGATAYLVGAEDAGFKQMMQQVNQSRLSNAVRSAAMMRRSWNEALTVARHRVAFGGPLVDKPLMRRQLMKILLPTEQALSAVCWTAATMERAEAGADAAAAVLRLLTPLLKFRVCRDNVRVAAGAMEVRGGNGYIADWVHARLYRDAELGTIWEGTSSVTALDVVGRAVGRQGGERPLAAALHALAAEVPGPYAQTLGDLIDRVAALAAKAGADAAREDDYRTVAGALYHVTTAVLLAAEGARLGAGGGDARRLLMSRLVVAERLTANDPLDPPDRTWQAPVVAALLDDAPVSLESATSMITG
ncbi:MAG TPA: acyl-CoA dehydrogenase family protein [Streptosporangiaceae bacterium]|jgi:alkylation response protein AidB-like acyl-CoA dehydrogenase